MANDMDDTVIPKSDQLNADDLSDGRTLTVTVTRTKVSKGEEQPVVIWYKEGNGETKKPYKPSKSMRRVLKTVWGSDSSKYAGKSMTLYCDPTVKFGGLEVGGIKISHMEGLSESRTLALTATKGNKKPHVVKPLAVQQQAPAAAEPPPITPETKAAGEAAAAKGVEAYTAWVNALTPDVKPSVRPFHKEWTEKAKAVVVKVEEEIPFGDEGDDAPAM